MVIGNIKLKAGHFLIFSSLVWDLNNGLLRFIYIVGLSGQIRGRGWGEIFWGTPTIPFFFQSHFQHTVLRVTNIEHVHANALRFTTSR